ncbi:MAG: IMP dehydrogenase, partial [Coriobacteriales bacterium]|nr:IMP dehydrogenase [Coriobacteriales bacterium]
MAFYYDDAAHTFNEYLLVPGYSSAVCIPSAVDLSVPLTKYAKGDGPSLTLNIPLASAIMQSVSNDTMAIALAREGGLSFIYSSQSIENQVAMIACVKANKAGFVESDSNLSPDDTLETVMEKKEASGHSTMPVTHDGSPHGKLLGIVTSRDYRPNRTPPHEKVSAFMTPRERLVTASADTSLRVAND